MIGRLVDFFRESLARRCPHGYDRERRVFGDFTREFDRAISECRLLNQFVNKTQRQRFLAFETATRQKH